MAPSPHPASSTELTSSRGPKAAKMARSRARWAWGLSQPTRWAALVDDARGS